MQAVALSPLRQSRYCVDLRGDTVLSQLSLKHQNDYSK